jgi:hypothetical protein
MLRVNVIINTPAELIKCRQQLNTQRFISVKEIFVDIFKKEGFFGLYRGFWVTWNRDVFVYGLYFYMYYSIKDKMVENNSVTNFKLMLLGGMTGVVTWFVSYPFDPLKTKIQINTEGKMSQLEAYKILKQETGNSLQCLYKGLSPTLLRAFFVNAVIFYTNDLCHLLLDKHII